MSKGIYYQLVLLVKTDGQAKMLRFQMEDLSQATLTVSFKSKKHLVTGLLTFVILGEDLNGTVTGMTRILNTGQMK